MSTSRNSRQFKLPSIAFGAAVDLGGIGTSDEPMHMDADSAPHAGPVAQALYGKNHTPASAPTASPLTGYGHQNGPLPGGSYGPPTSTYKAIRE